MSSGIEESPFVKAFTAAILKTIAKNKMKYYNVFPVSYKKEIINADLIPKLPEKISRNNLFIKRQIKHEEKPKNRKVMPAPKNYVPIQGEFGKIDALLKDPMITTIQCFGPNKNIVVISSGVKRPTRIILSQEEINEILKKIAVLAHVPLIEGVFRAAIRDFILESVVSKTIGSRFVIKKNNPFSLLEPGMKK